MKTRNSHAMRPIAAAAAAIAIAACAAGASAQPAPLRIIALGDSYSGGEGNPDEAAAVGRGARWLAQPRGIAAPAMQDSNAICHRSNAAWPARVAAALSQRLGREVQFASFACSGAQVPDLMSQQIRAQGRTGLGEPAECGLGASEVGGQLCELERLFAAGGPLDGQTVDAVVLTIGGNDVGFAPAIITCASPTNCADPIFDTPLGSAAQPVWPGFSSGVEEGKRRLRARLSDLNVAIERLNRRNAARLNGRPLIANVFALEYPGAFRDEVGDLCGLTVPPPFPPPADPDPLDLITQRELRWGAQTVMPALNDTLADCLARLPGRCEEGAVATSPTQRFGHFIRGSNDAFRQHGFCANERWVLKVGESIARQHDFDGAVHPNGRGHEALSDVAVQQLKSLEPPAPVRFHLGNASQVESSRLVLSLGGLDTRTRFTQLARRAVPAGAAGSGVTRLASPPDAPVSQAAAPPRWPVSGSDGWSIVRYEHPRNEMPMAAPAAATDFAIRTCTVAACSVWSPALRYAPLPISTQLAPPAGLRSRRSGHFRGSTLVTLAWNDMTPRPNGQIELQVRHPDSTVHLTRRDVGVTQATLALPGGLSTIAARQCTHALRGRDGVSQEVCGTWSEPLAVDTTLVMRRPQYERRPLPVRFNPLGE